MYFDDSARVRRARTFTFQKLVLATTLFLLVKGDGGGGCCSHEESAALGPPTEAVCPPNSTLTYDNFGETFMTNYCTRCHASTLTGTARQGAPAFHDFDTLEGVMQVADHIDEAAGAGPAAVNEFMPIDDGPKPTLEEREQLAEWIACGTP